MTVVAEQYPVTSELTPIKLTPSTPFGALVQVVITNFTPYIAVISNLADSPATHNLVPGMTQAFPYSNTQGAPVVSFIADSNVTSYGQAYITADFTEDVTDFAQNSYPALATVFNAVTPSVSSLGTQNVTSSNQLTFNNLPSWAQAIVISTPASNNAASIITVNGSNSAIEYSSNAGINVLSSFTNWNIVIPIVPGLDPALIVTALLPSTVVSIPITVTAIPQYVELPLPPPTVYGAVSNGITAESFYVNYTGAEMIAPGPWLIKSLDITGGPFGTAGGGATYIYWGVGGFETVFDRIEIAGSVSSTFDPISIHRDYGNVITPYAIATPYSNVSFAGVSGWTLAATLTAIQLG